MAISYGTYTITEVQEGSQIWTTTTAPAKPNYTFTVSNLVGDSDASVKTGDIIMHSYNRYTVLSVSDDGTTVLAGNLQSIRGSKGATGDASTTYSLIVSNLAIIKDKNGVISPTSITLTAKYQTGANAMANYSGRFKIETTTDNLTWVTQYTSSANEATKDWNVIDNIVAIRCSLYLKDGTTTLLDQQTIPIVSDGIDGTNGINTATVYLYKRGTTTPSVPSGNTIYTFSTKKLIGTLDNWSQVIPTTGDGECYVIAAVASSDGTIDTIASEEWSVPIQFNGTNGTNGDNGLNQATIFLYKRGASVTKPTTSVTYTFSTGALSAEPDGWKRNIPTIDGNPCWVVTATAIGNGTTATVTGSNWSNPIKLVEDGKDGEDAYTIILTNENHTFAGNTTSAIASEIECNVIAYKGATQVASTIGTITGQPIGMTTSLLNNGTINTAFKVIVDTTMITKNGVLNVPVTVDGKAFTKKFTYTLTLDGEKGDNGDTAQWYYGEALTHTSGTATLPISQTADVTVGAMYLNTKTGTCYKCTAISGSNVTWTYAGNITDGINIGGRNLLWNTGNPQILSSLSTIQKYGWVVLSGGNGVGTIETIMDSPVPTLNKTFRISNNTSGNKDFVQVVMPELETNYDKIHVFSAYVRGVGGDATALIRSWNNTKSKAAFQKSLSVSTNWQKIEILYTSFDNSIVGDNLDIRFGITGAGSIEYIAPKFECGNKATDWTPAPEDIDAEISTKADSTDAVFEEQLIYISKVSGTLTVNGTTTWITENGDVQNTWSTKRPTYNTDYPVLFIAKQRKTVSGNVTCTTPLKDDTTTIIDGGHITTGTIDASQVSVTNIDASNISTGTLSADRIGANSIDASKINVSSISIGNLNGASNYAQKTDVTEAINKEIGGRNLIIGTLYPDARSGGIYRPHIFGQITNTAGRGTCTVAEHGLRFTNTSANWQYIYFGASGNSSTSCMLGLEVGETYTLSADLSWKVLSSNTGKANATTYYMGASLAYSNTESGSFSGLPHSKQFAITQADKGTDMSGRLIYTFTVPETAKKLYLGIVSDNKTATQYAIGDYIEAKNLKLEKGSKATQWTPAPEDLVEQTGWSVLINVSSIDFINNTATLHASVYKDGNIQSSGFTLQWYKTITSTSVTPEETTTTVISNATSSILSVTDLDASYTCVVN